jgi:ribosomal protein L16/L10AE
MSGHGSTSAVENYLLHWREEHGANIGEGVSRTSDPKAHLYEMVVEFSGMKPMREWIRAMSRVEAAKFAANRYPTSTKITIITKDYVKQPARKRVPNQLRTDPGVGQPEG